MKDALLFAIKTTLRMTLCIVMMVSIVPFAIVGFVAVWADEGFVAANKEVGGLFVELSSLMADYIVH